MLRLTQHRATGKALCIGVFALCLSLHLHSQPVTGTAVQASFSASSKYNEIKPLNIGDKVPDIVFQNIMNYPAKTGRLSNFKGKLIILDFWSTFCGTCIQLFPHMNELKKKFGDQLDIILVNGKTGISKDDELKITKVLTLLRNKANVDIKLPIVYNCELLDQYFLYKSIPHEVWINKDNEVIAITGPAEVNEENIRAILDGKKIKLHLKKDDLEYNSRLPLFRNGNGGEGSDFLYRSIITGYKEGLGIVAGIQPEKDGKISRVYMINQPLLLIYRQAYKNEMMPYPDNRILFEVSDPSKFQYSISTTYTHSYCYELIVPPSLEEEVQKYMQSDLERYFHTTLRIEKRKKNCLVLSSSSKLKVTNIKRDNPELDLEKTTREKYIKNYLISSFVQILNSFSDIPFIDETGLIGNISVDLPYDLSDRKALIQALEKAGFEVKETERELNMVIISG